MTAEDAWEAVRYGVDGIIVSNHGARQLDHVSSTIDALPEVISAVSEATLFFKTTRYHPTALFDECPLSLLRLILVPLVFFFTQTSRPPPEVYIDGGFRRGTDVLKALSLGARAVFVGRPVLWGLAVAGEEGVTRVLEILRDELTLALALAGCPTLKHVNLQLIRHSTDPLNPPERQLQIRERYQLLNLTSKL
jgi:isopentenyl diphosphate isomerase/L-lactate dehydrogenase-like FMN-dependent dehydrogenase